MALDYTTARALLDRLLNELESSTSLEFETGLPQGVNDTITGLFVSKTQSYREVALGCAIMRYFDRDVDLSLPYINLGDKSYNGRTLDEKVINPFLHHNEIPASKGAYLATFRRSVKLDSSILNSQRDKQGFSCLLSFLSYLNTSDEDEQIQKLISAVIKRFTILRDRSKIELARIRKLHLQKQNIVIDKLLDTPSGGLIPVIITVALLKTISKCHSLRWEIDWQGINASDLASGAAGDVTIKKNGRELIVLEITERPIDSGRVVSTFNSKIVRKGISDYLFVYKNTAPSSDTKEVAERYFAQGHEINFVQIKDWVVNNLATIGSNCRSIFLEELIELLDSREVSSTIKVRWNEIIRAV